MGTSLSNLEIVNCPQCFGHGVVVQPAVQRIEPPCDMCDGAGKVLRKPCTCGRPIVYAFGSHMSCTSKTCHDRALKAYMDERVAK